MFYNLLNRSDEPYSRWSVCPLFCRITKLDMSIRDWTGFGGMVMPIPEKKLVYFRRRLQNRFTP